MKYKNILFYLLLLLFGFNLNSAEFEIKASVDATKIGKDDVLIYTIKIKGNNNPEIPDISKIGDFDIVQSQRGNEYSNINGRSSFYTNFTFYISPKRIGLLKIPPISYKYDGIICGDDEYTRKVLEKGKASKLKVLSKYGVGLDRIDLNAAKEFGITVTNCPGVNQVSVAEHVLGLLFAFQKNIHNNPQVGLAVPPYRSVDRTTIQTQQRPVNLRQC